MSFEGFLREWTERVKKQRYDLLATAYGFNPSTEAAPTWWARNYLRTVLYSFFGLSMLGCFLLGFTWVGRILALLLGLQAVRYLWKMIKKGWTLLKTYLVARRLSKQASRSKKD